MPSGKAELTSNCACGWMMRYTPWARAPTSTAASGRSSRLRALPFPFRSAMFISWSRRREPPLPPVNQGVVQDPRVVEDQPRRKRLRTENAPALGVVLRPRRAAGLGHVHHRRRVVAGVALRVGINTEQRLEFHRKRGLFPGLAHRRVLHGLAHVHETAGQGPAVRRIAALNEHDRRARALGELDDYVKIG